MSGDYEREDDRDEMLSAIHKNLTSTEFEEFVAALWTLQGYQTEVTKGSRDGGVDVIAKQTFPYEAVTHIEAKQYDPFNPNAKLGSPDVRKCAPPPTSTVDLSVLVTLNSFHSTAVREAKRRRVKLVDGESLYDLILRLGAEPLVEEFMRTDDVSTINVNQYIGSDIRNLMNESGEGEESPSSTVSTKRAEEPSTPTVEIGDSELLLINGLEPEDVEQLAKHGVDSFATLGDAGAEWVAEHTGHSVQESTAFIAQAKCFDNAPVDTLNGIGSAKSEELAKAGITTIGDLAQANAEELAGKIKYGETTCEEWIKQASERPTAPLTEIDELGSGREKRLNAAGFHSVADIAVADPDELAKVKFVTLRDARMFIRDAGGPIK